MSAPRVLRRALHTTAPRAAGFEPTFTAPSPGSWRSRVPRGPSRKPNSLELPSTEKYLNTTFPALPSTKVTRDPEELATYVPPPVTLKTLAPLIPATAASPAGLQNTLIRTVSESDARYRKPARLRYGSQEQAKNAWKTMGMRLEVLEKKIVRGGYAVRGGDVMSRLGEVGELGAVVGRTLALNGTATEGMKKKVEEMVRPWVEGKKGVPVEREVGQKKIAAPKRK